MNGLTAAEPADLTRSDYERIRQLVYREAGINLGDEKMQLVRARLGKRVRNGGFRSFREYYESVERDSSGEELCALLDAISTNTTHLFREPRHFHILREAIHRWTSDPGWLRRNPVLRVWSAGCSSGEEPHSIAMAAYDALRGHPQVELRILATDLSTRMLQKARTGLYEPHRLGTVPAELRQHYFRIVEHQGERMARLSDELQRCITFARFNLMTANFPFRHGFHVIFCRNVMIYFDRPTQQGLVTRLAGQLLESGLLVIGHSESLNLIKHPLEYVEPTVYRKVSAS